MLDASSADDIAGHTGSATHGYGEPDMHSRSIPLAAGLLAALTLSAPVAPAQAASHMDAPLITLDPVSRA